MLGKYVPFCYTTASVLCSLLLKCILTVFTSFMTSRRYDTTKLDCLFSFLLWFKIFRWIKYPSNYFFCTQMSAIPSIKQEISNHLKIIVYNFLTFYFTRFQVLFCMKLWLILGYQKLCSRSILKMLSDLYKSKQFSYA